MNLDHGTTMRHYLAWAAGLTTLAGCGGNPPAVPAPGPAETVSIEFAARVGPKPFACGQTYPGLGRTQSAVTPTDFRFYVHDVTLIDRKGRAVPLEPITDDLWQYQGVALLDFEDGTGPCSNGNADTRHTVIGKAPAGDYQGVAFTLGVPFALNHLDLKRQPSPLNVSSMFWAWRSGYKFLRLDMKSSGQVGQLFLHVGSTECIVDSAVSPLTKSCGYGNRSRVTINRFDPRRDTVLVDVAQLLAGADLDSNQATTAKGCMSASNDLDCAPYFANLGIAFGNQTRAVQRTFSVLSRRGAAVSGQ